MYRVTHVRSVANALFAFAFLALPSVFSCSSDGTDPGPPPPTPILMTLSKTTLAPGDTLAITGENFATTISANRVRFANSLANVPPFYAEAESLAVVVPQWAASGPLQVTSSGVTSAAVTVEVPRGVGDVWVVGGASSYSFKLPNAGNEEYLFIPYAASGVGTGVYGYQIAPSAATVYPAPRRVSAGPPAGTMSFEMQFKESLREQAIEHAQRVRGQVRPLQRAEASAVAPDTTTFRVLKCTTCSTGDPNNYVTVTAALRYEGPNTLVYADINQPQGSFVQADYDELGAEFDMQTFPTDTTNFGPPTDIDGNGKVITLFTPRVNDLTPNGMASSGFISGYFLVNDLAPNFYPVTSLGGEIFYAMVPDPMNEWGNTFSHSLVKELMPATLAHEFEHMISFGFRFVFLGNGTDFSLTQLTWLEEGMAHMAEDLNDFTSSNQNRINVYLPDIEDVSLVGSATVRQRGGIFLFLRYLADQFGDDILRDMVENGRTGMPCVESVTGDNFFVSVADYLATLYLDGAGVTLDPTYHYTSTVNLSALANAINSRDVTNGTFFDTVSASSGAFWLMTGIQDPATNFAVTNGGLVRMILVRTR